MTNFNRPTEGSAFEGDREQAARMLCSAMGYSFSWGCAAWLAKCFTTSDWHYLPSADLLKVREYGFLRLKGLSEIVLE